MNSPQVVITHIDPLPLVRPDVACEHLLVDHSVRFVVFEGGEVGAGLVHCCYWIGWGGIVRKVGAVGILW